MNSYLIDTNIIYYLLSMVIIKMYELHKQAIRIIQDALNNEMNAFIADKKGLNR